MKDRLSYHHGQPFSTRDQDNDASSSRNCAEVFQGAWWYKDCYQSNLNGLNLGKGSSDSKGIKWGGGMVLKSTKMAVRPWPLPTKMTTIDKLRLHGN